MSLIGLPPQPAGVAWPTQGLAGRRARPATAARVREARRLRLHAGSPDPTSARPMPWWSSRTDGWCSSATPRASGRTRPIRPGRWPRASPRPWSASRWATAGSTSTPPADVPEWRGAGRSAPRHHPRPLAAHVQRPGLRRGLSPRPGRRTSSPCCSARARTTSPHFAAAFPLEHEPGQILVLFQRHDQHRLARRRHRAPTPSAPTSKPSCAGACSSRSACAAPIPKFDAAGTFIGSSFCFCQRPRLRPLRPALPARRHVGRRTPVARRLGRLRPHPDLAAAGGPRAATAPIGGWTSPAPAASRPTAMTASSSPCVPDLDLIMVRHGATPLARRQAPRAWLGELIGRFR